MLNFEIGPDDILAMQVADWTDEQRLAAYKLQEKAFTTLREVLVNMGVDIRREDIWPTVENKYRKAKITIWHDFDPDTAGTSRDSSGWFVKQNDVLRAIIRHPYPDRDGELKCKVDYPTPVLHTAESLW